MSETELQVTSGAELRQKSRRLVKGPSGTVYRMRRPGAADFVNSGVLPEGFLQKFRALTSKGGAEDAEDNASIEDIELLETMQRAMVTASMLSPRIVEKAEADDEIEYQDIPPEDRLFLYRWCKGEDPQLEIEANEGTTSVGALESFSSQEQGSESPSPVTDGGQSGDESVALSGD